MTSYFSFVLTERSPFFLYWVRHQKTPTLGVLSAHPRHFHMLVPPPPLRLQSMGCSKLLGEGGNCILIMKMVQDLLKNWPQVCGRGLQGMGCSTCSIAEGGTGHTNFVLHKGLFDRGTDTKLWKSYNTLFSFIYIFKATTFSSIVRTGIILAPNPNHANRNPVTLKCVSGASSRMRMQAKSLGPQGYRYLRKIFNVFYRFCLKCVQICILPGKLA